jgi:pimeloyl-ACP methyl ester carboxylesterase
VDSPRSRHKVYPTLGDALARFRLRPGDTSAAPELLRAVALDAVTPVPGGWTWKFDPGSRQLITNEALHEELPHVGCAVGMVYGEKSPLVSADTVKYLEERMSRPVPTVSVPGAYHHIPLDAPDSCCAAIERLLAELSP